MFRPETPSSPALLQEGEGSKSAHYRAGLPYAGLVKRARKLRKNQTAAEDIVWELLRDRRFEGIKIRRQHQVGHYIADFFSAEHQLDIELDGEIHKTAEVLEKDKVRDAMLNSLGIKVLRFPNKFVFDHPDEFLSRIAKEIALPSTSGIGVQGEGHQLQMQMLSDRKDVIVIVDEAHRSQYDTLALNMRVSLPNAMFVAFTGTPLIAGEERTKEVFGSNSNFDFF